MQRGPEDAVDRVFGAFGLAAFLVWTGADDVGGVVGVVSLVVAAIEGGKSGEDGGFRGAVGVERDGVFAADVEAGEGSGGECGEGVVVEFVVAG